MYDPIYAGDTSVTLNLRIYDKTSTEGDGLSGLVHNTANLVAEYRRQGQSSWTSIPLAGAPGKTLGSWLSGGFLADGSLAGAYEFDPPNACFANGAEWVLIRLYGATNMDPCVIRIPIHQINYQDPARAGLTGLSANAPGTTGGLAVVGSAMTLTPAERTAIANEVEAQIIDDSDSEKVLEAIVNKINAMTDLDALTLAAIATAVRTELATELARIDVTMSSRLAAAGYTAPDNATISASNAIVATLQNRLGPFTGSGDNTVFGFMRAAMSKSAPTPTDIAGTYSAAYHSLQANAEEILSGGVGAHRFTVTVEDEDGDPVPSATVVITNDIDYHSGPTDVNGMFERSIAADTWSVRVVKRGYTTGVYSETVSGDTDLSVVLERVAISPPASPGLCTIRFEANKPNGDPIANCVCSVEYDANVAFGDVLMSNVKLTGTTDVNGICDLVVVQASSITRGSKTCRVMVIDPSSPVARPMMNAQTTIPNVETIYASSLIKG